MIRGVLFDFGETLIERVVDDILPLSKLALTPFPESLSALAQLKRSGYLLALVSNTSQSNEGVVKTALQTLGMSPYFDAVVTSVDVGHEKPHPAMFARALERLRCTPGEAVMVGDDLEKDVQGAATMGIITIHVHRYEKPFTPPDVKPTFTVSSLLEIPGILERVKQDCAGERAADRGGHGR